MDTKSGVEILFCARLYRLIPRRPIVLTGEPAQSPKDQRRFIDTEWCDDHLTAYQEVVDLSLRDGLQ